MPVTFGYTVKDMVDFMADCRVQQIFAQFVGSSPNTFNCRDSKDLFPRKPSLNKLKLSFPPKICARDFREEFARSPSLTEVATESCVSSTKARLRDVSDLFNKIFFKSSASVSVHEPKILSTTDVSGVSVDIPLSSMAI